MSKTILNMYMRKLSVELKEVRYAGHLSCLRHRIDHRHRSQEGFTVVMYSPGFVKTNL
jgi:hypothetical protein